MVALGMPDEGGDLPVIYLESVGIVLGGCLAGIAIVPVAMWIWGKFFYRADD